MEAYTVRDAIANDVDRLMSVVDPIASGGDEERCTAVERWVEGGFTRVVEGNQQVVGYCVLEYTFFDQGFITMLAVAKEARRAGVGARLLQDGERLCRSPRLFTSTNLSNQAMQRLLRRLKWESAGVVYGLDEGDPELFFRAPARIALGEHDTAGDRSAGQQEVSSTYVSSHHRTAPDGSVEAR